MTVALEWIITVHSFSVELYGHDSGIILYMMAAAQSQTEHCGAAALWHCPSVRWEACYSLFGSRNVAAGAESV